MIIPERNSTGEHVAHYSPFASKETTLGKMFRRKHGFKSELIASGETKAIHIVVPYGMAKINELELLNCTIGDTCNLKVKDTPTGTISGYPDVVLNTFGFDVRLPNGFFKDVSSYDADVIKDMCICIEYTNNSDSPVVIYGNMVFHEVVPS